jgi:hypothetical protein
VRVKTGASRHRRTRRSERASQSASPEAGVSRSFESQLAPDRRMRSSSSPTRVRKTPVFGGEPTLLSSFQTSSDPVASDDASFRDGSLGACWRPPARRLCKHPGGRESAPASHMTELRVGAISVHAHRRKRGSRCDGLIQCGTYAGRARRCWRVDAGVTLGFGRTHKPAAAECWRYPDERFLGERSSGRVHLPDASGPVGS